MRMLRPGVDLEFLDELAAKLVVRQHAAHRCLEHPVRMLAHLITQGNLLEAARVTGKVVIDLLVQLTPCHAHLVGIDDDHVVAAVHRRRVNGLVLALQHSSNLCRQASEGHAGRVDHVPLATRLGITGCCTIRSHVYCSLMSTLHSSDTTHTPVRGLPPGPDPGPPTLRLCALPARRPCPPATGYRPDYASYCARRRCRRRRRRNMPRLAASGR